MNARITVHVANIHLFKKREKATRKRHWIKVFVKLLKYPEKDVSVSVLSDIYVIEQMLMILLIHQLKYYVPSPKY